MISAADAERFGLVNFVAETQEELIEKCQKLIGKVINKAPIAAELIISSTNAALNKNADGYAQEANAFAKCTTTADFKEGVAAFLEKRKANFTGK